MNATSFLFVAGAGLCASFVILATYWKPWYIMLSGVAITLLGAAWGLSLIGLARPNDPHFAVGLGQMFMVFSSVVGGASVGAAFVELRDKRRQKSARVVR